MNLTKNLQIIFLLFVCSVARSSSSTDDEITLKACCAAGEHKSFRESSCGQVKEYLRQSSQPHLANSSDACINEVKKCCRKELASQNCNRGMLRALQNQTCSSLRIPRAEECCTTCNEGLNATVCSAPWLEDEPSLSKAFELCCRHRKRKPANQPTEFNRQKRIFRQVFCPRGSYRDNDDCVDLDECEANPCPSGYICQNRQEGYDCLSRRYEVLGSGNCGKGFVYSEALQDCIDRDECAESVDKCSSNEICMNALGGYLCVSRTQKNCETGYKFIEGKGCVDIDECSYHHGCGAHELCVNRNGHYYCVQPCEVGSMIDPVNVNCADFNECSSEHLPCSESEKCVNKQFGFGCFASENTNVCDKGFKLDDSMNCVDIDECVLGDPCGEDAHCVNTKGSFACFRSCGSSYRQINGTCIDVDECQGLINPCKLGQKCENLPGSFRCVDVDCELLGKIKSPDGSCILKRNCPQGFYHNLETDACTDLDECADPTKNTCHEFSRCSNTIGSYRCLPVSPVVCHIGFERTPDGSKCLNINECKEGLDDCDRLTEKCEDTIGNFTCVCKPGFSRTSRGSCEKTMCPEGHRVSRNGCEDINECEEARYSHPLCDHICLNTNGSYECVCYSGYETDQVSKNRCKLSDTCSHYNCKGNCEMLDGTLQCVCPSGFKKKNGLCIDIDECRIPNGHNCTSSKSCMNTDGGFKCVDLECPHGYDRDMKNMRCLARKECTECAEIINFIHLSLRKATERKPISVKLRWSPGTQIQFSFKIDRVTRKFRYVEEATEDNFALKQNKGSAKIVLRKPLKGPQEIFITLTAEVKSEETTRTFLWKIYMNVPGSYR